MARKPPSEDWTVSIDELAQGFRGRRFGELVLYHVKRQSLSEITKGVMWTISLLPEPLQGLSEEWIDLNNQYGLNEEFWRSDCGDVCLSIIERAKQFSSTAGTKADRNTLLNLFQIVVLSFAYTAHREQSSKAFIQKAIGMGFLRRFFSYHRPR
jgi:hypothetical protein